MPKTENMTIEHYNRATIEPTPNTTIEPTILTVIEPTILTVIEPVEMPAEVTCKTRTSSDFVKEKLYRDVNKIRTSSDFAKAKLYRDDWPCIPAPSIHRLRRHSATVINSLYIHSYHKDIHKSPATIRNKTTHLKNNLTTCETSQLQNKPTTVDLDGFRPISRQSQVLGEKRSLGYVFDKILWLTPRLGWSQIYRFVARLCNLGERRQIINRRIRYLWDNNYSPSVKS